MIGRNEDNEVVLDSPRVSRYHARVSWNGAVYRIEDIGSKNGTRLNGALIEAPTALKDSDMIQIGDVVLVFEIQGQQTITMADGELPNGCSRGMEIGGQSASRRARVFDPSTGLTRDVIRIPSAAGRVAGVVDLVVTPSCLMA